MPGISVTQPWARRFVGSVGQSLGRGGVSGRGAWRGPVPCARPPARGFSCARQAALPNAPTELRASPFSLPAPAVPFAPPRRSPGRGSSGPHFPRRHIACSALGEDAPPAPSLGGGEGDDVEALVRRVAALEESVARHSHLYHTVGEPEISDGAFDALRNELKELRAHAEAAGVSLPPPVAGGSTGVGAAPSKALVRVRHGAPMLSLGTANDRPALEAWFERTAKAAASALPERAEEGEAGLDLDAEAGGWVVEPKVDGLAVRLRFGADGRMEMAATRGDGVEGEDVTVNAGAIQGVPSRLGGGPKGSGRPPAGIEVRGEVYMTIEDFAALNAARVEAEDRPFANPRNAAAGSLRLLEPGAAARRPLSFMPYALVAPEGDEAAAAWMEAAGVTGQWEALEAIASMGFPINEGARRFVTFDDAVDYVEEWRAGRGALAYEADGAVIKANSLALHKALGSVGGDPRWAVAWKFPAAEATTKLVSVEYAVGRTGMVVPTAVLAPVEVGGVTIRHATLHNIGHVRKLGLMVGDTVVVRRAGDVIPQVMRALTELRDGSEVPWSAPTACPCGREEPLAQEGEEEVMYCAASGCPRQRLRQVEHWVACCVRGVGKGLVRQLVDEKMVESAADMYRLTPSDLLELEGFKEARAKNVTKALDASKGRSLPVFLQGLGIRHLGLGKAELLSAHYGSLAAVRRGDEAEMLAVPGLGPVTAISVLQWLRQPSNAQLLDALVALGAGPEEPPPRATEGHDGAAGGAAEGAGEEGGPGAQGGLRGKTVVVSGAAEGLTRDEIRAIVTAAGGVARASVTGATDLLAVGDKAGASKVDKARSLGVQVVGIVELLRMCGRDP